MYVVLELTTNFEILNTQIALSSGCRHGDVHLQDDDAIGNNLNSVTFGIRAERELSCNVSAFAWLQESFLFGRDVFDDYPNAHINGAFNTIPGCVLAWKPGILTLSLKAVQATGPVWFLHRSVNYYAVPRDREM